MDQFSEPRAEHDWLYKSWLLISNEVTQANAVLRAGQRVKNFQGVVETMYRLLVTGRIGSSVNGTHPGSTGAPPELQTIRRLQ